MTSETFGQGPEILEMLARRSLHCRRFTARSSLPGILQPWCQVPALQNICETSTRAYSQFITTIGSAAIPMTSRLCGPLLEKVFYNLFDNAIRHGENITHIRIYCVREGSDLLLIFATTARAFRRRQGADLQTGIRETYGLGCSSLGRYLPLPGSRYPKRENSGKCTFELRIPAGSYRFLDSDHSLNVSGSQTMNLHA